MSVAIPDILSRRFAHGATLALALALAACAGQQAQTPSPSAVPEEFSRSGDIPAPERWWTAFADPALDTLVDTALAANLDLRATYERLRQARALEDRAAAGLFPAVNATAGAARSETGVETVDAFSGGLRVSYEVDLWGRIRAQADAESLRAQATEADYRAASLALAGELAQTWFALLEQRAQRQLGQAQLQTNEDVLAVIEARFARGLSGSADVLRQRQLVVASREELLVVTARIEVLEHQLALLLGEAPIQARIPAGTAPPSPPPLPATGVPAELVQRRPDIQSAHLQLRAADADLAAAISARFPRLTLSGAYTSAAEEADALFDEWLGNLAGNLVLPLIDGGQRRAEVERNRALRAERFYQYSQATLVAFREVEDALVQEQQQRQRIQSLQQQIELADSTYKQLRMQYLNGAVSYIEVLNALQDRQRLRRTLITARRQLLDARVDLYRALAGGFVTEREEAGDT